MRNRLALAAMATALAHQSAPRADDDLRGVPLDELELGPGGIQRKAQAPKPEVRRVAHARREPNWDRYERVTGRSDEDILERRAKQAEKLARRAKRAGHRAEE
jgi:hypothetical protein